MIPGPEQIKADLRRRALLGDERAQALLDHLEELERQGNEEEEEDGEDV